MTFKRRRITEDVLHHIQPTSSFEKLMVAEAVITDLQKQLRKKDDVIFGLRNALEDLKKKSSAEISQLKENIRGFDLLAIKDENKKNSKNMQIAVEKRNAEIKELKKEILRLKDNIAFNNK